MACLPLLGIHTSNSHLLHIFGYLYCVNFASWGDQFLTHSLNRVEFYPHPLDRLPAATTQKKALCSLYSVGEPFRTPSRCAIEAKLARVYALGTVDMTLVHRPSVSRGISRVSLSAEDLVWLTLFLKCYTSGVSDLGMLAHWSSVRLARLAGLGRMDWFLCISFMYC